MLNVGGVVGWGKVFRVEKEGGMGAIGWRGGVKLNWLKMCELLTR